MSEIPAALPRKVVPGFAVSAVSVALALIPACASEPFQGELPPCRCEVETCSVDSCPIEVALDSTCVGEIELAEVMVDGHVEVQGVTLDKRVTTCSRIEPGASATIYVRGGPWVWGPLVEQCSTAREARTLILQCVEAR